VARAGVVAGTRNLRLRLERGGTLAGVVVTPAGEPLTRYQIVVTPADGADDAPSPLERLYPRGVGEGIEVDDRQGAFRLERLPAGRYDLSAVSEDIAHFGRLTGVTLAAGETKQGLRLVTGAPPPNIGFIRAR
jgi:hypothetical protein